MSFPEEFLHYVWQFRSFDQNHLETSDGEPLKVLNPGLLNKDAGPDFSQGKLLIGQTLWVGNIEIHLKSSDWIRHNHDSDPAYENVVLHVVYEHDAGIKRMDGSVLPVLELKHRIAASLIEKYSNLFLNLTDFPCAAQIRQVDRLIVDSCLSRTLVERFEQKQQAVLDMLQELNGNWDETFYRFLARNFGFKINALPFELLARAIPQNVYAKHQAHPMQIEALIFGAAGFLKDRFKESYPKQLKKEFGFLQKKYNIAPVEVSLWKFMRMRPQNFPTIRLAQFAALLVKSNRLFSAIIDLEEIDELKELFENLPIDPYWKTHYHFKSDARGVGTQIGKTSIDNLLLNTVALFLFAYGRYTATQEYIDRAIQLLESLPAEHNAIVNRFVQSGMEVDSAFASQGILQLKKHYCDQKKCLSCGIGIKILKQS